MIPDWKPGDVVRMKDHLSRSVFGESTTFELKVIRVVNDNHFEGVVVTNSAPGGVIFDWPVGCRDGRWTPCYYDKVESAACLDFETIDDGEEI